MSGIFCALSDIKFHSLANARRSQARRSPTLERAANSLEQLHELAALHGELAAMRELNAVLRLDSQNALTTSTAARSELGVVRQLMDVMNDGFIRRMSALEEQVQEQGAAGSGYPAMHPLQQQQSAMAAFGPIQQNAMAATIMAQLLAQVGA